MGCHIQHSGGKVRSGMSGAVTGDIDGSNESDNCMKDHDSGEEEFAGLKKAGPHGLLKR